MVRNRILILIIITVKLSTERFSNLTERWGWLDEENSGKDDDKMHVNRAAGASIGNLIRATPPSTLHYINTVVYYTLAVPDLFSPKTIKVF